jgi:flagellar assembly factor FliW
MRIHTLNFGDLDVAADSIIAFNDGLPGFPQLRRFVVLEMDDIKPFQYLQALPDDDTPPIALYLINPFLVDSSYEFRLTDSDMDAIKSTNSAELTVYTVVTIPVDPREATVNLMAPVVINKKDRRGRQVILHDSKYSVRHPLLSGAETESSSTDGETENQQARGNAE